MTDAAEKHPVNLPPPQPQAPMAQEASKTSIDGAVGSHVTAAGQDTCAEQQSAEEGAKSGSAATHSQVSTCCSEFEFNQTLEMSKAQSWLNFKSTVMHRAGTLDILAG